ncbi:MAG: bifunctional aldolase/short-chain dehydrogenase [Planctomycetota bacterium]|nr:MAG: bifunctional aldolase/short-chain dehydrogenase [Planctomycetota bacterium]
MKSRWSEREAARFEGDLGQRVYSSRLLGREKALVLHGGGNTSVKIRERDLLGETGEILYVKGSGWDLETIEAAGFAPVRLNHCLRLLRLERLSDPQMVNELQTHVTRAGAPAPSIETLLHAVIPHPYVDHTHADAVLAVTNTDGGEGRVRAIYGQDVVVVPYVMPGFDLARECAQRFAREATGATQGLVLLQHGIFSFGASARESYQRMIQLVTRAERFLEQHRAWKLPRPRFKRARGPVGPALARLRADLSRVAGRPLIVRNERSPQALAFAQRKDVFLLSQQGTATPDHVIRTKRLPMLGRDVDAYAREYGRYFHRNSRHSRAPVRMLDPAPRVVLDPELGLCAAGSAAKDAAIVAEIYRQTIEVILRAAALGGWRALPEQDLFAVEYWDLEQAKLRKGGKPPLFAGEVVLITGAASGIGRACVDSFLARGAAVLAMDQSPAVTRMPERPDLLGLRADVTSAGQIAGALERGLQSFGGLDMLVLNAGVFPASRRVEELSARDWRRAFDVNVDANRELLAACHPFLKLAPRGGRVAVIGSKNVPAPGTGAAAYSASKAALNQLARVAALEWGRDRIRVNVLHPNAVFDTALWTEDLLRARAREYGLSVVEYKRRNVLGVEVTSHDVAELAAELCGPLFSRTTGAQIPVDGGNERVI